MGLLEMSLMFIALIIVIGLLISVVMYVRSLTTKVKDHIEELDNATERFRNSSIKSNCPKCGNTILSPLRSQYVKKCTSCGYEVEWKLDPGQMPLIRNNRMVKKNHET